ncbi:hypothetical protein ThidrDRAFT_0606 [Thiorhodococcus drewsii AZ1]|uniref:Lipoprotein n=1 Tax=Thiorhodococcus drewsii AZ1 TaxID=765913 RepID=G2DX45_9GAMM|nr:hypothetical protein [Thiorhodococcus drewsii]EGV33399.1 hypothetical protein ThidrDRAFT_0606 [Thiorhodococcus drewsii AZ1]
MHPRLNALILTAIVTGWAGTSAATETRATTPQAEDGRAAYPTQAIADYVIGCMLSNGASAETLQKCSCSFDLIVSEIPYAEYEKAETLMRMQQVPGGGRAGAFRGSAWAKSTLERFKEVQAESTLRCF